MKCISKKWKLVVIVFCTVPLMFSGCNKKSATAVTEYEQSTYNTSLYEGSLYAENLCVSLENKELEGYAEDESVHGAALFDVADSKVLYAYNMHEKLYPASVTKIMTALLALEQGNMEDQVVISSQAAASAFPSDAQVCGLVEGEVWSLNDLVNALLLYSGNDAATAIAEHISGSEEAFVARMNERAAELLATNTHFTNPHGLHDDEHYTTVYDLYLIFNQCIKDERFVKIINSESYTTLYTTAGGQQAEATFEPTNLYAKGTVDKPENVTIVGGKTGTTGEAGYCLILLEYDSNNNPYISIVMGAGNKPTLYVDMTSLIQAIPTSAY